MTRINIVDPKHLSNKHLVAEFRELPRVFTAVRKLIAQGITPDQVDIPDRYVLGTGHVKHFYNKLYWLSWRYYSLADEMRSRKFKVNEELFTKILNDADSIPNEWQGAYCPSPEDVYLNFARLAKRSNMENVINELKS